MKYILILIFITTTIFANKQPNSLGIASAISQSEYDGVGENDPLFFPMFIYNGDRVYFRGLELGYKLIDTKPFKFSALVTPQMKNVDSGDSNELDGISSRDRTVETGFRIGLKLIPLISFSSTTKVDTLFVYKGFTSDLAVGILVPFSKSFIIRLSAKNIYLSKDYVDYYYGVDTKEVTSSRSAYSPEDTNIKQYGATFIFNISKNMGFNITMTETKYSDEIKNSPIVSESKTMSILGALSYKF